MAYHELGALIVLDPPAAKKRIIDVLQKSKMCKEDAASKLDCSYATLLRWIEKLGLTAEVKKLVKRSKKEGWHHGRKGGRPKGSTVANGAAPRGSRVKPV